MFRLYAVMMVALTASLGSLSSAQIVVCSVSEYGDNTATLPVFETKSLTNEEYETMHPEDADGRRPDKGMVGDCREFLGQLCDDHEPCTVDYDEASESCLEFPREKIADCALVY